MLKLADSNDAAVRTGLFCFAAGGLGRADQRHVPDDLQPVRVDWEFGKDTLRTLGALRPFVGGVFGLMTFFALKSGVVALDIVNSSKSALLLHPLRVRGRLQRAARTGHAARADRRAAAAKGKRAATGTRGRDAAAGPRSMLEPRHDHGNGALTWPR